MEPAEQPPLLTQEDRAELIRELAALPDVTALCLDPTFRFCAIPDSLLALGVVGSGEQAEVGEIRDTLSPREGALLMGAIGRARRWGAADLVIHPALAREATHLAIIDVTEEHGVYVTLTGDQVRVPNSSMPTEAIRPRRVVHHRNEIAELIWVDPLTEDMLGLDPQEMVGQSALHYIHPDDHDRGIDAWLALLAGQPPVRHRVRWATGDGGWNWIEITHTDRLDTQGYVESEMVDVEDEMHALALAREGEVRFNTLTESLPMGVIHVDAEGEIAYMNTWLRDFVAFDSGAEAGKRFESIHPDDRQELTLAFGAASARGAETDLDIRVNRRRHNDERICRVRVRPVAADPESANRAAIASVEDITDSVKLETRLRRQAMTDDLTGLHNRPALIERLQRRLDVPHRENGVAALFIDLDGF